MITLTEKPGNEKSGSLENLQQIPWDLTSAPSNSCLGKVQESLELHLMSCVLRQVKGEIRKEISKSFADEWKWRHSLSKQTWDPSPREAEAGDREFGDSLRYIVRPFLKNRRAKTMFTPRMCTFLRSVAEPYTLKLEGEKTTKIQQKARNNEN